ncbi:MAG: putative lipid II flippase FtsW [Gammaproteobacteria bacterium]|nr:putative lipid II flippase FtsW [Gammaproteobacteria bacterium]NIR98318.1 putative lipid II flippase FtsW [Gammaproteobacteria bacterium]NIT64065.1 putative lipid II flippase FtsW [Gammaproteobacteria bacterium]NIV20996.1 putative lipid II flippase FtsW [Gammaproteobacteria bacterium]NIX10393.1 putative lipid II flippase FtsW [Gammaproteobacteria bacterium]
MARTVAAASARTARRDLSRSRMLDTPLLVAAAALVGLGLVMVASSSITIAERELAAPFYYFKRQLLFVVLGVGCTVPVLLVPLEQWRRSGPVLLIGVLLLLSLVLMPGVGKEVNGSTRWLPLGVFYVQVSELAKLFMVLYLAGYLVRRGDEVRASAGGFLKPVGLLALTCALLLAEPDFGAAVVLLVTCFAMMYLAGVRLWQFGILVVLAAGALGALAFLSPYRWARVVSFLNPWADPYNSGFQLVQSLIAFGRGEWLGVGLGASVQKLFYLPEAHTDFLFAVIGEELGLAGTLGVIGLFATIVWRACLIGARAERNGHWFAAYLAHGLGLWLGLQAFINIGVNMGVLPTKGLTLPLMSYGGSSMVMSCVAVGLLLRAGYENARAERDIGPGAGYTAGARG